MLRSWRGEGEEIEGEQRKKLKDRKGNEIEGEARSINKMKDKKKKEVKREG